MPSRVLSVPENSGLVIVGSPLTGTDLDVGQTLTYTISLAGNTGGAFGIHSATAQLNVIRNILDFESQAACVTQLG